MGNIDPPGAPLWVLQPSTVNLIAVQLQQQKLLPSPGGHLRDWRGVAQLSGLAADLHVYEKIKQSPEPFAEIFNQWKKLPNVNVKDLWTILEQIDRFDVQDDVRSKITEDIEVAHKTANSKGLELEKLNAVECKSDEEALTMEDLDCLNSGKPLPVYDAFILYGEEDSIVKDIVSNLEAQGLKILIKDRDLLGGTFEHAAVMKLISTRCTKLVPLFSPSFFGSEYNTFLTNFVQHLSLQNPGKIMSKIIPIVSDQRCEIPPNLAMYSKLKYEPNNTLFNFWERLVKTINPAVKFRPIVRDSVPAPTHNVNHHLEPNASTSSSKKKSPVPCRTSTSSGKNNRLKHHEDEFSNVVTNGTSSSELSSLESEVTGDSGALLLPDVPSHEPGLMGWMKSKLPNKRKKTKYKQIGANSSAC